MGTLNLAVPQDRKEPLHQALLPLPKKREGACVGAHGDVRGKGPTRKVKEITEELCGTSFKRALFLSRPAA